MPKSILSRARMRADALKREENLDANTANVVELYELIAALAQELAVLQADADNQGYASPPAGTQTIIFADERPPSIKAIPLRSMESPAPKLRIVQVSECE